MIVQVVVPARNEAHCIGACLRSIGDAYDVTVVAHRCTDDTAAIARTHGARVIECDDDGGKLAALRAGVDTSATRWVLVDADVTVGPRTLPDLLAALDDPSVLATCPPLTPQPPRRRTPLSWALHRYNATRGFSSERRWLNGRCVALRWLELPTPEMLHTPMLAEDIWLSRALIARNTFAIAHVDTDAVRFHAPETLTEMYRVWRRLSRELRAVDMNFPELKAPPPRRPDLLADAPLADRVAWQLFHASLALCRGYGAVKDAFGFEEDPWPPK